MKILLVTLLIAALVSADTYMQNPRGSNNRVNEANTNAENQNRLFDSQNNAKGGYCRGPAMTFYTGSLLTIQWTAQHGCGRNPALLCNVVIQAMCSRTQINGAVDGMYQLRDGTDTDTIPDTTAGPTTTDASGNFQYGMHEPYYYYQMCKGRDRDLNLFIADREQQGGLNEGRRSAVYTRQNNDGANNRHGYECTEERDYYPYWGPSPWVDIAILTQNTEWCSDYQSQSQNGGSGPGATSSVNRGYCKKDATDTSDDQEASIYARYIHEADCIKEGYEWVIVPEWGVAVPECVQAPFTRENHLGNGFGAFEAHYNWTIPDEFPTDMLTPDGSDCVSEDGPTGPGNCNCALRLRYNISTTDLSPDCEADFEGGHNPFGGFLDASSNGKNSPVKQNPTVEVEGHALKLAINTNQFGRTFQDRSHMFHIAPRPTIDGLTDLTRIHNLNVKGKRGNIVQTYPATEYDFVPAFASVVAGDFIHFQWTGCDTNPAGNAGEGTAQTDRSNIVQLTCMGNSYPADDDWLTLHQDDGILFEDKPLRDLMTYLGQTDCNENTNDDNADDNCKKLNKASQYFNAGLVKANSTGEYVYMSSRNNNFSNRAQKGALHINSAIPPWAIGVLAAGAAVFVGAMVVGGLILYAKTHPYSGANKLVSRL